MLLDIAYVYVATVFGLFVTLSLFSRGFDAIGGHRWGPVLSLRAWSTALPIALQLLFAVVITDFTGYWKHRLMHTRLLWPFHAVHHSSEEVDWLSNERVHPVESLMTALFFAMPLVVCGVPAVVVVWTSRIRRFYSIYEHANLRIDYGRAHRLFVSPTFHRFHHSSDVAWMDMNYANIFSAFDWMFGTLKMPVGSSASFGVPSFPRDFWGQMVRPFRGSLVSQAERDGRVVAAAAVVEDASGGDAR